MPTEPHAQKPHKEPAAQVETEAQRVERETLEHIAARRRPAVSVAGSTGSKSKLDAQIAGLEKDLARYEAARADGNPRKQAIADLNGKISHFKKLRDALPNS